MATVIKDGKFYKTRDGRKVGPIELTHDNKFPFKYPVEHGYYKTINANGSFYGDDRESCYDLVDDWYDEPPPFKQLDEWKLTDWQRAYANFDSANRRYR